MGEEKSSFRKVNQMLGAQPNFGPFPADQLLPWIAIAMLSYWICKLLLGLNWVWTGIIIAWGISTWWVLTGSKAWRFLSKFMPVPTWSRGFALYQRITVRTKARK